MVFLGGLFAFVQPSLLPNAIEVVTKPRVEQSLLRVQPVMFDGLPYLPFARLERIVADGKDVTQRTLDIERSIDRPVDFRNEVVPFEIDRGRRGKRVQLDQTAREPGNGIGGLTDEQRRDQGLVNLG